MSIKAVSTCFFLGVILLIGGCLRPARQVTIRIDSTIQPSAPFHVPLKNPKILSHFGPRRKWYHTGLDMRGRRGGGDKVLASRAGEVIRTTRATGYGKMVVLKHADGYKTHYAHLKKFLVKKGDWVDALQPIGIVGKTGRASTPHLHFEILTPSGAFVDPKRIIFK